MAKDNISRKGLSQIEKATLAEVENRCLQDTCDVLSNGGLQTDLFKECWKMGFLYAGEYIRQYSKLMKKERKI